MMDLSGLEREVIRTYICVVFLAATTSVAQDRPGFIHGTLLDPAGAVFVGVGVEVSSQEHACKTTSNVEGKFNCQLPPGGYNVSATAQGLMPYRRATVNLKPSAHVFLKLRPVLRRALPSVELPDPQIGYEEQLVSGSAEVLVRYHAVEKREGQITFHGPYLMLTIDALAIYADEMTCTNPILTCTAKGSVIAELGEEQIEGTTVELDLLSRKLVLTRNAEVVKTF
jgi:carboxypeptidase family protein